MRMDRPGFGRSSRVTGVARKASAALLSLLAALTLYLAIGVPRVQAQDPVLWWMYTNAIPARIDGFKSYGAAVAAGLSYVWGPCLIYEGRTGPYEAWWFISGGGADRFCPDFQIRAYCPNYGQPSPVTGTCPSYGTRPSLYRDNGTEPCNDQCKLEGHPIYPATGNKHLRETDYAGTALSRLRFVRYYNSAAALNGALGRQWLHEYERSVQFESVSGNAAYAYRQNGTVYIFQRSGTTWVASNDINFSLERLTDSGGNPSGWRLRTDVDEVETYDAAGRLLQITNRNDIGLSLAYDGAGRLGSVTDWVGRALTFQYDSRSRLASMTDPAGGQYGFAYIGLDVLAAVAYPDGKTRGYLYEDPRPALRFALTGVVDENGARHASYTYLDTSSDFWTMRALTSELAGGADRISVQYQLTGATQAVTNPLGNTRSVTYEVSLNVARPVRYEEPCPGCATPTRVSNFAYDPSGNMASRTDWNGNITTFQYDLGRNLETLRGEAAGTPQERRTATEWHGSYRLPSRIAEPLRISTFVYGEPTDPSPGNRGSVLSKTVQATTDTTGAQGFSATPVGAPRIWTYTYNANGQVLTANGPRTDVSDVTTYTYYPNDDPDLGKRGNLATITNAAGHVTEYSAYNAHGQLLTIVDPNGLATTLRYDQRLRLTSRSVGGELTVYDYDGVGQVTKVALPDGSFLTYTYDAAHRLTQIADNFGNRSAYTLDAMGNRTREDLYDPGNALAQTRSRVYSSLNRLDQEIGGTNPAAQITRFAYDKQGNVTGITDPLNRVTANAYDALNRLKQMTDPAAGVTVYGYDGRDQLTSVRDPRSNATSYALDGLGNLSQQSSPDTGNSANTHDAAGNLLSSTDAKGQTTSYTYDALNRITRIVHVQAVGTQLKQIDYLYDQGANARGRLSSIAETAATGATLQTTTYGYDPKGRVTSEARTIGGVTYTTAYAYDSAGRMTGMTYPSGRTLAYGLDGLGRANRIETTGGGTTEVVVQDVLYQPFGPVKSFTSGNLQANARSFDLDGRIAAHSLGSQAKALNFDAASRITRIEQQGVPTNFTSYGYDALDRLTSTILPTSSFSYGYDAVGNRTSKSTGASTDLYSYPATSNRLAQIAGSTPKTYAHDPNGSITGAGADAFGYDARGRLVSSTSASGATSYQVNALGQRVRKTSSAGDTIYHYDTQGRLIGESSAAGVPIREHIWLADQPVAVAVYGQMSDGCRANPTLDSSNTFVAFARRERMEVHSGRPGERGWEWGLGTNTRDFNNSARADLDWVSGKPYGFVLTYDGAGNARVAVRDGASELFALTWTGGMDVGNALRFMVRSPAGIGAGNRISALITSIDGQAVSQTLATAGDDAFSEVVGVYAGTSLRDGYSVEGTVTFTFTGRYPPRGNQLDFTVTAGNVTCQGTAQAGPPVLYYVHADHLNTPRVVTDAQQRVVWRWENFEPFGNNPPDENPSGLGEFAFPLRFPGTYADRETGTLYNWHRDLDPATARYLQFDPIGLRGGINGYLYGEANPLSNTDPLGLYVPWVHRSLTLNAGAVGGLSAAEAAQLAELVVLADKGTQGMSDAHRHAMCPGVRGDAPPLDECIRRLNDFVRDELRRCTQEGLANAIHAIQDSFAGGHRNMARYTGQPVSPLHLYHDLAPTRTERYLATRASADLIRQWKANCSCAQ